jgi:hypothetical protein
VPEEHEYRSSFERLQKIESLERFDDETALEYLGVLIDLALSLSEA